MHCVNREATGHLTDLCRAARVRLVYVSTDLVFDGGGELPRKGSSAAAVGVRPSKLAGEQAVLASPLAGSESCSLMYGPSVVGRPSFFDEQSRRCVIAADQAVHRRMADATRPSDGSSALVAPGLSEQTGLFHIGGPEQLTRWQLGQEIATCLGVGSSSIVAAKQADVVAAEPRPQDVSLEPSKRRAAFPEHPWPAVRPAQPLFRRGRHARKALDRQEGEG